MGADTTSPGIEIDWDDVDPSADRLIDISTRPHSLPQLAGAVRTTFDELLAHPTNLLDPTARNVIVCDRGVSSRVATAMLRSAGASGVVSMRGGTDALRAADDAVDRYDRQIRLAGFGQDAQDRLGQAIITVVGAGGLGCPALNSIVPAGAGTVRIIDFDTVAASNLHRQPLFTPNDVGMMKAEVAATRLGTLNPDVRIETSTEQLSPANAGALIAGSDVVVDATDSFDARDALTAACIENSVPMVYGSIFGFEGQHAVFDAENGPCYRCVFPTNPEPGTAIDCSAVGTLGAVTSVIGSLQGAAAVQVAAGIGGGLTGSLTMYDARTAHFDHLPLTKDPACTACGK